jgi:spoIIIJ-associated protein
MLERMAQAHAAKVREARQEIVITDLKPHERRIIHLALENDPDVETYSEGEGDERYIVISPKADPGQ